MDSIEFGIHDILLHLGITSNYKGYNYVAIALHLCLIDPTRLQLITKLIYPEVARQCSTTWTAVERDIRTVISIAWSNELPYLEFLGRRSLPIKPSNAQFLAILTAGLTYERSHFKRIVCQDEII